MATISRRKAGYQAQIRRTGYPTRSKCFTALRDAEACARQIEHELDRGLFLDRTEADIQTYEYEYHRSRFFSLRILHDVRRDKSCSKNLLFPWMMMSIGRNCFYRISCRTSVALLLSWPCFCDYKFHAIQQRVETSSGHGGYR